MDAKTIEAEDREWEKVLREERWKVEDNWPRCKIAYRESAVRWELRQQIGVAWARASAKSEAAWSGGCVRERARIWAAAEQQFEDRKSQRQRRRNGLWLTVLLPVVGVVVWVVMRPSEDGWWALLFCLMLAFGQAQEIWCDLKKLGRLEKKEDMDGIHG